MKFPNYIVNQDKSPWCFSPALVCWRHIPRRIEILNLANISWILHSKSRWFSTKAIKTTERTPPHRDLRRWVEPTYDWHVVRLVFTTGESGPWSTGTRCCLCWSLMEVVQLSDEVCVASGTKCTGVL
jgi:hypothetical protein